MNISSRLLALVLALPLVALAADAKGPPPDAQPVPDGPPTANDIAEPQITIRNMGTHREEEYRLHGKLYMVKIIPPKGKPYYLVDNIGNGKFVRYEGPVAPMAVPQWVIHTF
ncbi:MAG TPA: DUF2782 domain-containing protein [Thiobacillaceae bacterium]|nr:DUF2782 domain-containing protein [Thiobacillaceae bacterium]